MRAAPGDGDAQQHDIEAATMVHPVGVPPDGDSAERHQAGRRWATATGTPYLADKLSTY